MTADRVWNIISEAHICMLVTNSLDGLRARPLDARPDRKEGALYFLIDIRGSKDDEIEEDSRVCLIFVDPAAKTYLSVTGDAAVVKNAALAKILEKSRRGLVARAGRRPKSARIARYAGIRRTLGWTRGPKSCFAGIRDRSRERDEARTRGEDKSRYFDE